MRWAPLPPSPGGTGPSDGPGPPPSGLAFEPPPQPEARIAEAIVAMARETATVRDGIMFLLRLGGHSIRESTRCGRERGCAAGAASTGRSGAAAGAPARRRAAGE